MGVPILINLDADYIWWILVPLTIFLDAEYFLPLRMESKADFQGTEVEVENIFGDYKEVGGLMVAHSMQMVGGAGGTLTMNTIEIDPEIDDSIFKMPEPAPAAEGSTDG